MLVVLKEQADTPKIANMAGRLLPESLRATIDHRQMKSLSRRAVVNSLLDVADRTQRPLLNHLSLEKLLGHVRDFKSFYIVNMLYLEAHPTIITALSRNPAVKSILPNIVFELQESSPAEVIIPEEEIEPSAASIEWNIKKIRADEVWDSFGVTGEGVVVGTVSYTHLLQNKYSVVRLTSMVPNRTTYSFHPSLVKASPHQVDNGVNTR